MAFPLVILGVFGKAIVQVLTKPAPWLLVLGWVVVSKFDFGLFAEEARETLLSLWWVVVLILISYVALTTIRITLRSSPGQPKS